MAILTARSTTRPVTGTTLGELARRDEGVRFASLGALAASLLLVTYWWLADRGLQDLAGWTSGLTSVGRLSGLVASVLLLAQVLLMARVPVFERAFGQDRLARVHRWVGFTSLNLMVLHIVTITWGYAGGSLPASIGTLWNLTTTYAGMLLAFAGSACLVMVAITSVKAARRRLRYESWHLMHLYAYLGVGLALPHQLWTGQAFTGSPVRTVFWWGLWGASVGAVLIWRIGRPLLLNLRHRLVVTAVVPEGPDLWSVHLTGRRLDLLPVAAGQFFTWRFLAGKGWTRANPYSLSASPDAHSLRITIQGVGDGSRATGSLRPGTRALVEGPFGRLSERPRRRTKVAMIGAGVGVTPLRALAEGLDYAPGDAVYVERYRDVPLFTEELTALETHRGLRILRLPGTRRSEVSWLGSGVGHASDLDALTFWVPDISERDVYVCGPKVWADLVVRTLDAAGVPAEHIHLETFAW